jgi:hypothetical protein
MRKLITLSIVLLIALLTTSAMPQKPQTWEYKFDYKCQETRTNALAAEGWELHQMSMGTSGALTFPVCVFKRPK